jgi:hypothetical protein
MEVIRARVREGDRRFGFRVSGFGFRDMGGSGLGVAR